MLTKAGYAPVFVSGIRQSRSQINRLVAAGAGIWALSTMLHAATRLAAVGLIFALSQLPSEKGIPILIRLARSNKDPKVRRKALFWLGQSDDPRALALIEEILTKG